MWTDAGLSPSPSSVSLRLPSPPTQEGACLPVALPPGRSGEACELRPAAPAPPPAHSGLTQKLVEDVGDRIIPAALEKGQASWCHGFLVLLVEIKGMEGPLGKLVAVRRWGAFKSREWGLRAPHPSCSPTGNPEKPLRICLARLPTCCPPQAQVKRQRTEQDRPFLGKVAREGIECVWGVGRGRLPG